MDYQEKEKKVSIKDFEAKGIDTKEYEKVRLYNIDSSHINKKIYTFGYVEACTPLKNRTFIILYNSLCTIKCVVPGSHDLTFQTSLYIYGTIKDYKSGKDEYTFELDVDKFVIYNGEQAPAFPLNEESDKETRLNHGHIATRLNSRRYFPKLRHEIIKSIRSFYNNEDFIELTPPTILSGGQAEGGSDVFNVDYYGEKASLTQSSQFFIEAGIGCYDKVYAIMPSYRAEKSKTARHLSEFTHVEGELSDISYCDLLDHIEAFLRHVVTTFYKNNLPLIIKSNPEFQPFELSDEPFKRLSYADAIEFFQKENHLKTDQTPYKYMDDISDASEKFICSKYGNNQPVFLTLFPVEHKSFYMRKTVNGLTLSCDLLFPGVGETVGGSMRIDDYQELYDSCIKAGMTVDNYSWYLQLAQFGPSPHGGYGLGFERLMMGLLKYKNVDEACLFPRKVSRCYP